MPRIRFFDTYGSAVELSSTNPVTIALWLYEHATKFTSVNAAMPNVRLEVWPMHDSQGKMDWEPGQQHFIYSPEQLNELATMLHNSLWPPKKEYTESPGDTILHAWREQDIAREILREQMRLQMHS